MVCGTPTVQLGSYAGGCAICPSDSSAVSRGGAIASSPAPPSLEALSSRIDELDRRVRGHFSEVETQLAALREACGLKGSQRPLCQGYAGAQWQSWASPPFKTDPGVPLKADPGLHFDFGPKHATHEMFVSNFSETSSFIDDNITKEDLEDRDGHLFECSSWDCSVFIGLDCMGSMVSASLVLLLITNMVVQGLFCFLIYSFMLDDPVGTETLDGLLRFRTGEAHNALYADQVMRRSLAAQVCNLDAGLHWANSQVQFLTNVRDAAEVGPRLCVCAMVCWLATMIKEAMDCSHFFRALWMRRGDRTTLAKDGDAVALHSISYSRMFWVIISVVVPRLTIVAFLTPVGMIYLVYTISPSELVLNAMALTFIIQIDEIFFEAFAPRRMKCLLRHLKPVPVASWGMGRKMSGMATTLRLLMLVVGIVVSYFLLLQPVYDRMSMVDQILCSGDQDFIYSVHPSTQVVQVTRSDQSDYLNLSDTQLAVLQLAHPNISKWKPELAVYEWADIFQVLMFPNPLAFANHSMFDANAFHRITATVQDDILQGSSHLTCQDWDRVEAAVGLNFTEQQIKLASKGKHSNCSTVNHTCSNMSSNSLRALCPVACGCSNIQDPAAGFFASPQWGCPMKCHNRLKAAMGLFASMGYVNDCQDMPPRAFSLHVPLKNYISGFYEYFLSLMESGGISISMKIELASLHTNFRIPSEKVEFTANKILDGTFLADVTSGYWRFAPGVPHPRGLTGCQFWTSWEVVMVFGTNLCDTSYFRSLRMFCPESCGCRAEDNECPLSCPKR